MSDDAVKIDVQEAEAALRRLVDATGDLTDALHATADRGTHDVEQLGEALRGPLAAAMFTAEVAASAFKEGLSKAFEFVSEGVKGLISEDKGIQKLSAALKQLGYDSKALLPALNEQADELSHLALVDESTVRGIQQLLIQHGIAPSVVGKSTKAILDYSAATGQDAKAATQNLLRAMEAGKEEMGRLGISINATGDSTKDLSLASDALTEKYGGSAAAATSGMSGQVAKLQRAQEDLSKAMGEFVVKAGVSSGVTAVLTQVIQGMTYALGSEHEATQKSAERAEALANTQLMLIDEKARLIALTNSLNAADATGRGFYTEEIAQSEKRIKKLQEHEAAIRADQAAASKATVEATEGIKKVDETGRTAEANEIERKRRDKNERAAREAAEKAHLAELADMARVEEAIDENRYKEKQEIYHRQAALGDAYADTILEQGKREEKEGEEDFKKYLERLKKFDEDYAKHFKEVQDELKSAVKGLLDVELNAITTYITTKVQAQEKDAASAAQQVAAQEKALADVLANIAKESAVKAIFEGAEALAFAATGDIPSASLAASSAAAFGAIALASGIGAYAITSARGLTQDEQRTQDAQHTHSASDPTGTTVGAAGAGGAAGVAGTGAPGQPPAQVNVYYIGIAGVTEQQQARELERIQRAANASRMGGQ